MRSNHPHFHLSVCIPSTEEEELSTEALMKAPVRFPRRGERERGQVPGWVDNLSRIYNMLNFNGHSPPTSTAEAEVLPRRAGEASVFN